MVQEFGDLIVLFLLQIDEILAGQAFHRIDRGVGQGMILRQDHHQVVLEEEGGVQVVGGGQADEAAVHQTFPEPGGDLIVFPIDKLKIDVGIEFVEGFDHLGQTAAGDAGEGPQPDGAGAEAVELRDGTVQILIVFADGLQLGEEGESLRADLNAGAVPGEELHPPGVLQIGDHSADGRLGVAQLRGGVGDAPGLDGL